MSWTRTRRSTPAMPATSRRPRWRTRRPPPRRPSPDRTNAPTPGPPERPDEGGAGPLFRRRRRPQIHEGVPGSASTATTRSPRTRSDDGQFGAAPILTRVQLPPGRDRGRGAEPELYEGRLLRLREPGRGAGAGGTGFNSAQSLLFSQNLYSYVASNSIYLDHSQTFTGSAGASYLVNETRALRGADLRQRAADRPRRRRQRRHPERRQRPRLRRGEHRLRADVRLLGDEKS